MQCQAAQQTANRCRSSTCLRVIVRLLHLCPHLGRHLQLAPGSQQALGGLRGDKRVQKSAEVAVEVEGQVEEGIVGQVKPPPGCRCPTAGNPPTAQPLPAAPHLP